MFNILEDSQIPLMDLKQLHSRYEHEIFKAIRTIYDSSSFVSSLFTEEFETDLAKYLGAQVYCATCASGTDALTLALMQLDLPADAEVLTVSFGVVCGVEAIRLAGAKPVLVDINPDNLLMNPESLREAITDQSRCIMPVHLFGNACNMQAITEIAKEQDLIIIEDCAQALGTEYKGQKVGTFGHIAALSFYPSKNLGAMGDGGGIVSKDSTVIDRFKMLRNHGRQSRYLHELVGMNSRLAEIQAAILNVKLKELDREIVRKRQAASIYEELIADCEEICPLGVSEDCFHSYHLYVVRALHRNALNEYLRKYGIGSEIHYPYCVHQQPAYKESFANNSVDLYLSEIASSEVISLPIFPDITLEQQKLIVEKVKSFYVTL